MTLSKENSHKKTKVMKVRSKSLGIPTPLRRALQIYHISTSENLSFDPTTPLTTAEQHPEHSLQKIKNL